MRKAKRFNFTLRPNTESETYPILSTWGGGHDPKDIGSLRNEKMRLKNKIHDMMQDVGLAVWCGGMLESGVGRAHNVALASLPNFTLPGDISASSRYWHSDIVSPEFTVADGHMAVPTGPGIGVEIDTDRIESITTRVATFG